MLIRRKALALVGKSAPHVVKVGIIDSGVNASLSLPVAASRSFCEEDSSTDSQDHLGHGTAVATVISANATRIELYNAQVFGDKLVCPAARVARAIDWLVEQNVDLINMSFGLREDRSPLQAACDSAIGSGLLLVAASPARGQAVFPAAYPGVIRATGDARCAPHELSNLANEQADYGGCPQYPGITAAGASIGCASVTGIIARLLTVDPLLAIEQMLTTYSKYNGRERRLATTAGQGHAADTGQRK